MRLLLQRWNPVAGGDDGLLGERDGGSLKLADVRTVIEELAFEAHTAHPEQTDSADIPQRSIFRPR